MVLGISSFTYGWALSANGSSQSLNEQYLVAQALNFGLKCLQIGDNLPLHTLSSQQLSGLRNAVHENNIRLEVGARGLTEDHLHRYLDIAASLQSPLLRFVVDGHNYEPALETITTMLKNILPNLKKHKITLGIENHDRFRAVELRNIMETISDDHIGICLDSVNSIGAGEGLEWVTNVLAPYTVNLHIKDFSIRRFSHNMGFTVAGAPAGTGMLDLSMIMEKLSKYNRCQSAVLEQWVIPEDNLYDTIKKEKQWATEGIQYLKQLPYFRTDTPTLSS
jgi:3-oxoisoapionate decarboxylase